MTLSLLRLHSKGYEQRRTRTSRTACLVEHPPVSKNGPHRRSKASAWAPASQCIQTPLERDWLCLVLGWALGVGEGGPEKGQDEAEEQGRPAEEDCVAAKVADDWSWDSVAEVRETQAWAPCNGLERKTAFSGNGGPTYLRTVGYNVLASLTTALLSLLGILSGRTARAQA